MIWHQLMVIWRCLVRDKTYQSMVSSKQVIKDEQKRFNDDENSDDSFDDDNNDSDNVA